MIRLIRDLIGVAPIRDQDKSQGGIWIPDMAKERADQGIVKYVGPKVKYIKIGDYVLFSGYTGTTVELPEEGEGTIIIFREKFATLLLDAPDTEVSGLYFRSPPEWDKIRKEIVIILNECIGQKSLEDIAHRITEMFSVYDQYFPATYEMAMNLIAEAFRGTDFAKNTGFNNPLGARDDKGARPELADYDDDDDDDDESDIENPDDRWDKLSGTGNH